MVEEMQRKTGRELQARIDDKIDNVDTSLSLRIEQVIDSVTIKFRAVEKLVVKNEQANAKLIGEADERLRGRCEDQNQIIMTLISDMQSLKVAFEGIRKPFTTEMNNLRKENENINRELTRLTGNIREIAVQQAKYPRAGLNLPNNNN